MFDYIILDAETRMPVPNPFRNVEIEVFDDTRTFNIDDIMECGLVGAGADFCREITTVKMRFGVFLLGQNGELVVHGLMADEDMVGIFQIPRQGKYIIQFHINDGIEVRR